jgi:hypothetical protein
MDEREHPSQFSRAAGDRGGLSPVTFHALYLSFFYLLILFSFISRTHWTMDAFPILSSGKRSHLLSMFGADTFSDSCFFIGLGQTMPLLEQYPVPAVPSQMAVDYWHIPPLADFDPAMCPSVGDAEFQTLYAHGTEFGCRDPPPFSTHQQAAHPNTVSAVPGTPVDLPQAYPTEHLPTPIQGRSTDRGEDVLWFLRMHSRHLYECSWDDGLGGLCGYSGTHLEVKRHLRNDHSSVNRYLFYHRSLSNLGDQLRLVHRSTFCSICKKSFSSAYSLKLHKNRQ